MRIQSLLEPKVSLKYCLASGWIRGWLFVSVCTNNIIAILEHSSLISSSSLQEASSIKYTVSRITITGVLSEGTEFGFLDFWYLSV